ncbi:S8 family peptidase [Streptomyces sp. NPDC018031]|uniref:S8 family peptidase n=1 Tax=Streptomyces sp. NPDC018031 TaxID=3365033 RepID=UPI0037A5730B
MKTVKSTNPKSTPKPRSRTTVVAAAAAALPVLFGGVGGQPATAAEAGAGTRAGTVHIVQVHGVGATKDEVTKVAREMTAQHGGELRRVYHSAMQGFSVTLTDEQVTRYYKDTRVDSVTGARVYRVAGRPSAAGAAGSEGARAGGIQFGKVPWGLDRIDQRDLPLDQTYRFPNTASNVRTYVVDTGVRTGHQEFGGRARGAYDAITQTVGGGGTDCNGHGTASASVVAGRTTGVAKAARVESVRAFGCDGTGTLEHLVSAVDWITANAVRPAVVNLGFSGPAGSVLDLQLYEMTHQGIAYTAAAGNGDADGNGVESCETTPARQTTAITVAATDPGDNRPAWSNYGYCVHLFAPGTDIPSASAAGTYAYGKLTGTSAATAEVTGAAAMYLSAHPSATPEQVDKALADAATVDHVKNPGADSKNLLLHTGSGAAARGAR